MPLKDKEAKKRYQKQWYAKNRTKAIADALAWAKKHPKRHKRTKRASQLKLKYGITIAQHEQMYKDQEGLCAACREPSDRTLHIDHAHVTGEVRGLLCWKCNVALGVVEESLERLASLIDYLLFWRNR